MVSAPVEATLATVEPESAGDWVELVHRAERQDPDTGETSVRYAKHGWNHYGPGWFELDRDTGVLESHGGMGLLWYSVRQFADFELELEFMTSEEHTNSGVFLRVPEVPTSDEYIYESFEVQINDAGEGIHATGAVYDAEAPTASPSRGPGEWNRMGVRFVGDRIQVWINDEPVIDWSAEPRGKVKSFAQRGYLGLQNHDWDTSVSFRNIRVRDLG